MVAVSVFHAVVHFAVCDTAGEKEHGIQSGGKLGKCDSSKAVGSEQMGRSNKGTCVWLWLALPAMLWRCKQFLCHMAKLSAYDPKAVVAVCTVGDFPTLVMTAYHEHLPKER